MSYPVKGFSLSSSLKEDVMVSKKPGIVTILGSDCERTQPASLRRTLSADMSSKRWQAQHGFYPLKKTASSDRFPPMAITADSSSDEDEYDHQRQIQQRQREPAVQSDIWSSILSQKAQEEPKSLPPPYVHPLVKRSASSLSEKSLEICTESLGSETGSDCFSSYPASEAGEAEEDQEQETEHCNQQEERVEELLFPSPSPLVVKYNNLATGSKKSVQRSLPPPIRSLSSHDGASLLMRSRRDNGRLVLEAVSVPPQNNFRAQREGGRLVLTLIDTEEENEDEAEEEEQFEVEFENSSVEKEDEEEEMEEKMRGGGKEEVRFSMEEAPKVYGGAMSLHRLALMMNKSTGLTNRNPIWPACKLNQKDQFEIENDGDKEAEGEEEVADPISPMTQSLPPRPRRMIPSKPPASAAAMMTKAATSFNAYEYFWKEKSVTYKPNNNKHLISQNLPINEPQQKSLPSRGSKGDYLGPLGKGCKEPRRSFLFWEPPCIATS